MVRSLTRGRVPKPLALLTSATLALFWVAAAPVGFANAAVTGGFEIDGNKTSQGNPDWDTVPHDVVSDPTGNADTTVYSNGAVEGSPSGWQFNGSAGAPDSGDIGDSYVADGYHDGDFWLYYGFDRVASNGTIAYALELNQKGNTTNSHGVAVPDRTAGDLRFSLVQGGNGAFTVSSVERWTGSGWTAVNLPASAWDYAVSGDKNFVEFAFNLSTILKPVIGDITCGNLSFSQLWLRSRSSQSMTSQLKDFATGKVSIDACAAMTIKKVDANGSPLPGATFTVTKAGGTAVTVTDGGSGDADGVANGVIVLNKQDAGSYEVRELLPPRGYLFDKGATQSVTLAPGDNKSVTFTNGLGSLEFTKTYEGKQPSTGAEFTLTYTKGWDHSGAQPVLKADAGAFGPVKVVDNGVNDLDAALGKIKVGNLQAGEWAVTETAPPAGWNGDGSTKTFVVGPYTDKAAGQQTGGPTGPFVNTLRPVDLKVLKTGSIPGVDGTSPLAGATFTLYRDNGDGVFDPTNDYTEAAWTKVSGGDGSALWSGLNWQERYWLQEVSAPAGYQVGMNPNPQLVSFDAPTADGVVKTIDVDNPRKEFSVKLEKVDAVDGSALTGGGFQLWRETNGQPGLQTTGPNPDLNVNGTKALENGELRFDAADHHIPWGFTYYLYEATPPTGYGFMSPNPIVIDGTSPTIAGTTVTRQATDPREPAGLRILKKDDFGAPVAGAVFQLYLSDGDAAFEPCDTLGCTGDQLVGGQMTSGDNGLVEWPTGLTWGKSYWVYEVSAPAGYRLMDPNPAGPVEIPKSAAGGVHDVTGSLNLIDKRVRGGFTISKEMVGLPEGESPSFTVDVDCGAAYYQGQLTLESPTYKASVTGVPVGEQCTVTEPTVPAGWELVDIQPSTVTVVQDAQQQVNVTVTNERQYDRFSFEKKITGTQVDGEQAGFTVFVDCASADPGANDYDQTVELSTPGLTGSTGLIPTGLECSFTETRWDADRYEPVSVSPSSATVGDGTVGTITVTNKRLQGTLTVAKDVVNPAPGESDTFPITVDCSNGYSATFDLADGQSATIEPQPVGVTCQVSEGAFDTDRYEQITPAVQTGTVKATADTVTVVNERLYGSLTVTKDPQGLVQGEQASFEVLLDCTGETYDRSLTLNNGNEFTATVDGLPTTLQCTVSEPQVPAGWQLVGIDNPTVTIVADGKQQVNVEVTNQRVIGGFPIVKTFADPTGLPAGESPSFTVTVDCVLPGQTPGGVDVNDPGAYQRVLGLTPQNGYRTAVSGIPTGMTCTVDEVGLDGGTWELVSITPSSIVVTAGSAQGVGVTVENQRLTGGLTIEKKMTGLPDGESPVFGVEADCTNGTGGTLIRSGELAETNGYKLAVTGVPTGWTCTVAETQYDAALWQLDGITYPGGGDSVTIADGDAAKVVVTVENSRLTGGFEIVKDFDGPLGLPQDENPEFTVNVVCDDGYQDYMGLKLNRENDFRAVVEGVPTGVTCTVGEEASDGWVNTDISPETVTVTKGDTPQTVTVTVTNERVTGGLVITKDARGLLDGENAVFTVLLDCTGTQFDQTLDLSTANGFSVNVGPLPVGVTCTVTETDVPEGWSFVGVGYPNDGDSVTVTEGDEAKWLEVLVTNGRHQGDLTVLKVNETDQPLAGAVFTLTRSTDDVFGNADDVVVGSYTTDGTGRATASGLDWGFSYFWEETKAPEGYNLPTDTVQGPIVLTAQNVGSPPEATVFVDYRTELTTTPFVGEEPVRDLKTDIARVDENDAIRDRSEIRNLSEPATGNVTFSLYGPFKDTTLNGMSFETVDCTGDPVFVSEGNEIAWNEAAGYYEAFSESLAVGGEDALAPGLYQWVADFVATDGKNVGATGACPDETEMVVVRAGDEPGLEKTADPADGSLVQPEQEIAYRIQVSNSGDVAIPAEEAVVTDVLDPWLTYVDGSASLDPTSVTVDEATGETTIVWHVGELASGAALAIDYRVVVSGDVPQNEALDNEATFMTEFDSTVHVVPAGDLTVVKQVDPPSGTGVIPGETLTYTLDVTATGELDQREVLVMDNLPGTDPDHPESLRTSYVVGSADCDDAGPCEVVEPGADGTIVWSLGDLAAGASRTVTFQVTVDQVATEGEGTVDVGDVLNTGWVSSYDTDWTPSNTVVNPVAVVLGVKIPNKPENPQQPVPPKKPETRVLGSKLPRTGSELGAAAWMAGALLVAGAGLLASTRRRGRQEG